jgi:DNA-binding NarL/FixJ family response regulator
MDLQMPKMSGLEATRELLSAQPQVRVVVLSGQVTPASAKEAMILGAAGFLLKEEDPGDLPQRIRIVAAGGTAWSEAATELRATGQA